MSATGREWRVLAVAMGPAVLYLAAFFVLPAGLILFYSFASLGPAGEASLPFTLANYRRALDPLYLGVLGRTLWLAGVTTAVAAVVAFPAALAIRALRPAARLVVLLLITAPSWTNLLIKNYAWIVLLRREGVMNTALAALGVVAEPLPLLFNDGAVLVGLLHTHLPFMILPLYAALERVDWRLVEAARDLGAGRWRTLRHVLLPQTRTGLVAGCVLVFVPALGAFVTPALLGGGKSLMIGALIESQVLQARDWPFAAALSVWLLALVLGVVALQQFHARGAERERSGG